MANEDEEKNVIVESPDLRNVPDPDSGARDLGKEVDDIRNILGDILNKLSNPVAIANDAPPPPVVETKQSSLETIAQLAPLINQFMPSTNETDKQLEEFGRSMMFEFNKAFSKTAAKAAYKMVSKTNSHVHGQH